MYLVLSDVMGTKNGGHLWRFDKQTQEHSQTTNNSSNVPLTWILSGESYTGSNYTSNYTHLDIIRWAPVGIHVTRMDWSSECPPCHLSFVPWFTLQPNPGSYTRLDLIRWVPAWNSRHSHGLILQVPLWSILFPGFDHSIFIQPIGMYCY